jgi:hypothetical protein
VQTGARSQWCCVQDPPHRYRLTYNYVLEIPDNNEGPNQGDDFFVVIRTSNTVSDGDDFRVRMDTGSITYRNYKEISNFNLAPGANDTRLITNTVTASVPINLRLNDLTKFQQRVDPLISPSDLPLEVLGLNADVAADEAEQPQPGLSDEAITSFVLELVTRPRRRWSWSRITRGGGEPDLSGDTARGEILTVQDADYYTFTAPAGVTRAKLQPWAESFTTLVIQAEVQDATARRWFRRRMGRRWNLRFSPECNIGSRCPRAKRWVTPTSRIRSDLGLFLPRSGSLCAGVPCFEQRESVDLAPFSADTSSASRSTSIAGRRRGVSSDRSESGPPCGFVGHDPGYRDSGQGQRRAIRLCTG